MSKFYGIISYMCGSVAIALLAIALITGGGRNAWATDCASCGTAPTPVMPGDPAYPAYQMANMMYMSCMANCTTPPPPAPCNCGPQPGGSAGDIGSPWYMCMMMCGSNSGGGNTGVGFGCRFSYPSCNLGCLVLGPCARSYVFGTDFYTCQCSF